MDINELKRHSDLSFDRAVAKKNLLSRAESELITVYDDHIFRADSVTIATVRALMEHRDSFFLLDANSNPTHIKYPKQFLSQLLEKQQAALNTYHQAYQSLKSLKE
jgi:fumarylacetoacetate (FAA) hydrolase family protein